MTTRAAKRSEGPATDKERALLSNRLAKDHALQTHDDSNWTHLNCFFFAAIHGLNELGIFDNISLTQMRRNVMHWLETKAPEVQIQAWHAVAYPQPGRIGSFTPVSMECIKQCWIAHCQGYADTHTGDGQTLVSIANLYNCNVTVHTSTYFHTVQPTNSTHNARVLLFILGSSLGVVGPVRGLRGGGGGWCEEQGRSCQDHPTFSYH